MTEAWELGPPPNLEAAWEEADGRMYFHRARAEDKPADSALPWVGLRELEKPLPKIPYVCEGMRLSPGAVSLVAGYGYSGKTMAAQSLLVSVAAGKPIWGVWDAVEGPVGHLDYEQGPYLCAERLQRLARGMKVSLAALADDRYRLTSLPATYLTEVGMYDHLCKSFESCKVLLVDSLRAACPSLEENSSDARLPLDVLSRVGHAIGIAILIIHHARKPSEDAPDIIDPKLVIRGSSAIFDAAQSAYVLVGKRQAPAMVHHVKDRYRGLTLDPFGLSITDPTPDAVVVAHLNQEQMEDMAHFPERAAFERRTNAILEAVRAGCRTANETWKRTRGSRPQTLARIKEMLKDKELVLVDGALALPPQLVPDPK